MRGGRRWDGKRAWRDSLNCSSCFAIARSDKLPACRPGCGDKLAACRYENARSLAMSLLFDAIQMLRPAQKQLLADHGRRCIDGLAEAVGGQDLELVGPLEDQRGAVLARHVDAVPGP